MCLMLRTPWGMHLMLHTQSILYWHTDVDLLGVCVLTHPTPLWGWYLCVYIKYMEYVILNTFPSNHTHFLYVFSSYLLFKNQVWFVMLSRPVFCDRLMRIITNKWVFLPLFAEPSPIIIPIASPIFVYLRPPSNTKYIRHLSRPG